MVRPALRPALKTALALAALAAAGALSGCEDRAYPSPAHEASDLAPAPTELAGAPSDGPAPAEAAPPPAPNAPAPPPAGYDEAAPPTRAGGDSTVVYDLGPVVGPDRRAPAAPPPPPAPAPRRHVERPVVRAHAPPPHRIHPRPAPTAPAHAARAHVGAASTSPAHTATTSVRGPLAAAAPIPAKPHVAAPPAKPAVEPAAASKPEHKGRHHGRAAAAAAKAGNATDVGDHAAHLAALQTALSDAVSAKAVLRAPGDLPAGRGADVTLTLPAGFADTVRAAAQKEGLADAAASVNVTALLAGDGYTVQPDAAQSQPLTLGQPTEFHWTATANPGAKGALHADVGAELLGGGAEKETLSLGAVQASPASAGLGPKLVGAGILGLIVVAVLAWLSRSRGTTPAQQASARRAAARGRNGIPVARPLDMTPDGAPPPPPPRDAPRS